MNWGVLWAGITTIVVGLVTNELTAIAPSLARKLLRLAARVETDDLAERDLIFGETSSMMDEEIPGKLTKLGWACGRVVAARRLAALRHRVERAERPPRRSRLEARLRVMEARVRAETFDDAPVLMVLIYMFGLLGTGIPSAVVFYLTISSIDSASMMFGLALAFLPLLLGWQLFLAVANLLIITTVRARKARDDGGSARPADDCVAVSGDIRRALLDLIAAVTDAFPNEGAGSSRVEGVRQRGRR